MCGVAGFMTERHAADRGPVLTRMMNAIRHRGPDGDGQFFAKAQRAGQIVALGHLRLAIVDLATGNQPMASRDSRFTIVFNGEIYNYIELRDELKALGHSFCTASDTEVLLAAYAHWGGGCLGRFRGMFAFAIWDEVEQSLFLARDPLGKKPLFYLHKGREFAFGSEFAALCAHPEFDAAVNPWAVAQYLMYKYVPGPHTLIAGIEQLAPGHYGIWRDGTLVTERYYAPPMQRPPSERLPMSAHTINQFAAHLTDAVRLRLRSDVPLGAFLSGGIDSSTIVALMTRETGRPVKTFSIGFDDAEFSELWAARQVAGKFQSDHHELCITPGDFIDNIEAITWLRGAPLSEMADVPLYFLSKLAAQHVKVVLSGEGADELLAGYPKHWGELWANRYQAMAPASIDSVVLDGLRSLLPYSQWRMAIALRSARERDFIDRQAAWFGLMTREDALRLAPRLADHFSPFVWTNDAPHQSPLHRTLRFDKMVWLPGTLLERGDRMTMAASIEGRMPFMDTALAEFVARLPDAAFLRRRTGKVILRKAMADILPPDVLNRPKWGFRVPMGKWLRGPMRDYLNDMLLGANTRLGAYLERSVVAALIDEHQMQRRDREKELWGLLSLEIFLRQLASHSHPVRAEQMA